VRSMCRVLMVHFSGYYAWLKEPLSQRAQEDMRQTDLIQQAWADSGKVYGYRKLHDDLLDQGEICSENRVARLASLAGITAQIGYKRRPGRYGGKPAVVADNTLDRQFEVDACFQGEHTVTRLAGIARLTLLLALRQVPAKFLRLAALRIDVLIDGLVANPVRRTWFNPQPPSDLFG